MINAVERRSNKNLMRLSFIQFLLNMLLPVADPSSLVPHSAPPHIHTDTHKSKIQKNHVNMVNVKQKEFEIIMTVFGMTV